jgi:hypothetical protein
VRTGWYQGRQKFPSAHILSSWLEQREDGVADLVLGLGRSPPLLLSSERVIHSPHKQTTESMTRAPTMCVSERVIRGTPIQAILSSWAGQTGPDERGDQGIKDLLLCLRGRAPWDVWPHSHGPVGSVGVSLCSLVKRTAVGPPTHRPLHPMIGFRYSLVENPVPEVKASTVRPRPLLYLPSPSTSSRVAGRFVRPRGSSRMSHQTAGTNEAVWGTPTNWQRVGGSQEANNNRSRATRGWTKKRIGPQPEFMEPEIITSSMATRE